MVLHNLHACAELSAEPFLDDRGGGFGGQPLGQLVVVELQVALKGGSRIAPELELERALVDVTRGPEAPAKATG